ncbi:MAG: hypothetical protein KDB01_08600 [Planctomycetaceae bacterium]|nr:hypothetical protein [Planctomycetaceae bacterium]
MPVTTTWKPENFSSRVLSDFELWAKFAFNSFLQYLLRDPAFVVNRYRIGGLGVTFRMDEDGLAAALAAMGTNTRRVQSIFEHLDRNHNSDADDVAVRYVDLIKSSGSTVNALKANRTLITLLIKVMDEGVTTQDEKKAIAFLKTL